MNIHTYALKSESEKQRDHIINEPVVDIVDEILYQAIALQASDIHIHPEDEKIRIRYRIDGILYDQTTLSMNIYPSAIARIKVLSNLDIAQTRLPQDGKLQIQCKHPVLQQDVSIDIRISTFPSIHGEKMVLRILDKTQNIKTLNLLGLSTQQQDDLIQIIHQQHGFLLVTGPTGSGKSTTLYALLNAINNHEKNIVTMEDPVEYDIPGITQSQVNLQAGLTFANGLRNILRQDPDVILIGEIRDRETIQIAVEASLTGHLVLSTLHTNNATGAITRLLDMGIEPFLINATLSGILAQRLVRTLCPFCKKPYTIKHELQHLEEKYHISTENICQPNGCDLCRHTGYKGRIGVFELLIVEDTIKKLIMQQESQKHLQDIALQRGMKQFSHQALEKLAAGEISIEDCMCLMA